MMDLKNCFTYAYSAGTHADFVEAVTSSTELTNVLDLIGADSRANRYLGIDFVAISEAATGSIVAWIDENAEPDVTLFDMDDTN